jgi:L-alanine-DL-glutamate epimerase-like enolase superfamily enzyme
VTVVGGELLIEGWRLTRFDFPTTRPWGDAHVAYDGMSLAAIELECRGGHTGLGFVESAEPQQVLGSVFARTVAPGLVGQHPLPLLNRVQRHRGGNIRAQPFAAGVDQALWDLVGKAAGLPLYRLFGGTDPRVRAYASGLEFNRSLDDACAFFREARRAGFRAFKCKVGRREPGQDIERLLAFQEILGPGGQLMADANESWSPKEAIARLHAFADAGVDLYWIEDPCLRDDIAGLARVSREAPFVRVNAGEYVDRRGKWRLLEGAAVDVLNINDHLSDGLLAGRMAAEHGIPVSIGNTPLDLGVHLAAALPEVDLLEWSMLGWDVLADDPIGVEDGMAIAPDRPGHGIALAERARRAFTVTDGAPPKFG